MHNTTLEVKKIYITVDIHNFNKFERLLDDKTENLAKMNYCQALATNYKILNFRSMAVVIIEMQYAALKGYSEIEI